MKQAWPDSVFRPEPIFDVTAKKKEIKKAAARGKSSAVATSSAILGRPIAKGHAGPDLKKVKPEWQKFCLHLLELREQLVKQMNGLAEESAQEMAGYSLHMADSGTDNFDRDFALSLLSADQDAVYEIEEALKRIDLGTYGMCEMSGKPIAHPRLEALPFARYTVECQSQIEKQGKVTRARVPVTSLFGLTDEEPGESEEEETVSEPKE